MPVTVQTQADWSAIAAFGGPVLDPMIVRCGELFLRGATGVAAPSHAWDVLTRNIMAIGTFFDRIILEPKLPVFNYADTFDHGQNFEQRVFSRVNATEEVLVDVQVSWDQYQLVKAAALTEVLRLYGTGNASAEQEALRTRIDGELAGAGYAWYPELGPQAASLTDDQRRLASFLLGGMIFGGYAQLMGAAHFMQPKRSRLFLALSLNMSAEHTAEEHLFRAMATTLNLPHADVPFVPSFFPLLLHESSGPADLLDRALALRAAPEVGDYRHWLTAALADFSTNGRIGLTYQRDVATIAARIKRRLDGAPWPDAQPSLTAVSVDLTKPMKAAWGWVVERLPGYRHHKLLSRAVLTQASYVAIDRRVHTVWHGGGVGAAEAARR
jgi:hypothetical protein